jgi:hypothetical protein
MSAVGITSLMDARVKPSAGDDRAEPGGRTCGGGTYWWREAVGRMDGMGSSWRATRLPMVFSTFQAGPGHTRCSTCLPDVRDSYRLRKTTTKLNDATTVEAAQEAISPIN